MNARPGRLTMMARQAALPQLLATALVISACSPVPATRLHLIDGSPPASADFTAPGEPDRLIFIDRVAVARYADRAQLVTRASPNRLQIEEFDAWAEPVAEMITAALVDALGASLGYGSVMVTPDRQDAPPSARLTVELLRLDGDPTGLMTLDARWTLLVGADQAFAGTGRERISAIATDPASADARVVALQGAVIELAHRLARQLPGRAAARTARR
jgi:uncharacterized lipoprotein YmbA